MSTVLELKQVGKRYGDKQALKDVSLTVEPGRIIGLLGPNGSGKTTLLKLINGLLQPTTGTVEIGGMPPSPATKRLVSYLPERTYLNDWMRVSELLRFFADFYEDFDREKAYELIDRMGVPYGAKFRTLSKGTKEKLQLILVMSRRAELYLLDEPIGGVDPAARDFILDVILSGFDRRSTIILSTHLIYDIERVLDDAVIISQGGIFLADSCGNIRSRTGGTVNDLFREVFRC